MQRHTNPQQRRGRAPRFHLSSAVWSANRKGNLCKPGKASDRDAPIHRTIRVFRFSGTRSVNPVHHLTQANRALRQAIHISSHNDYGYGKYTFLSSGFLKAVLAQQHGQHKHPSAPCATFPTKRRSLPHAPSRYHRTQAARTDIGTPPVKPLWKAPRSGGRLSNTPALRLTASSPAASK